MTVDLAKVATGASRGFTVLLLGGVVQPWVAVLAPPLGFIWLALVAVAAFLVAAMPRRGALTPATGAVAAVASYALVVPLVLSGAGGIPVAQLLGTTLTAVLVGSVTAVVAPRLSRAPR